MFLNDFTLYFLPVVSLTIYLKIPNEQLKKTNHWIKSTRKYLTQQQVENKSQDKLIYCLLQYPLMCVKKPLI